MSSLWRKRWQLFKCASLLQLFVLCCMTGKTDWGGGLSCCRHHGMGGRGRYNQMRPCTVAGVTSHDHTRKLCAAMMHLVFGAQYTDNPDLCSQFGRTKLFLREGQVSLTVQYSDRYATFPEISSFQTAVPQGLPCPHHSISRLFFFKGSIGICVVGCNGSHHTSCRLLYYKQDPLAGPIAHPQSPALTHTTEPSVCLVAAGRAWVSSCSHLLTVRIHYPVCLAQVRQEVQAAETAGSH